jgi:hypothetical protein
MKESIDERGRWMQQHCPLHWTPLLSLWLASVLLLWFFAAVGPDHLLSSSEVMRPAAGEPDHSLSSFSSSSACVRSNQEPAGEVQEHHSNNNKTLVVYVYFEKDQICMDNLQFFLEVGVQERYDVDYIIVLQGPSALTVRLPLLSF